MVSFLVMAKLIIFCNTKNEFVEIAVQTYD